MTNPLNFSMEKLIGRENYASWAFAVKNLLQRKNCGILSKELYPTTGMNVKQRKRKFCWLIKLITSTLRILKRRKKFGIVLKLHFGSHAPCWAASPTHKNKYGIMWKYRGICYQNCFDGSSTKGSQNAAEWQMDRHATSGRFTRRGFRYDYGYRKLRGKNI